MLGSPITPHNKARMNAAELDADLWLDRARDLCGHREALVDQLKSLGTQLQTANPDEAASLRPKSHALLRELREAACHVKLPSSASSSSAALFHVSVSSPVNVTSNNALMVLVSCEQGAVGSKRFSVLLAVCWPETALSVAVRQYEPT